MKSGLHTKPPRSDPDKWKPLIHLVIPLLTAIPLAFIEYFLVADMLRTGSLRGLLQASIYGILLLLLILALFKGVYRWLSQPPAEQLTDFAQAILKREMPEVGFSARSKVTKPPQPLIYGALPAAFGILAIYLACIDRLSGFLIVLFFALLFGGLMFFIFQQEKQRRRQVLTFDPSRRVIIFENFGWSASFLPTNPAACEEIPFNQLLGTDYYPPGRGPASLSIRTTKGSITLTDELQEFERIHAIVDSLVLLNKADRDAYQENLNAEPTIETPWYGWLILIVAIAAIVFLGWKFMYAD